MDRIYRIGEFDRMTEKDRIYRIRNLDRKPEWTGFTGLGEFGV